MKKVRVDNNGKYKLCVISADFTFFFAAISMTFSSFVSFALYVYFQIDNFISVVLYLFR